MNTLIAFLIGLLSGIIASLLVDNKRFRFRIEFFVRKILKIPCISVRLKSFEKHCKDGWVFTHCIENKNNMLFTHTISNCYLKTQGFFSHDSRAYKPLIYFRSHGMDSFEMKPISEVANELSAMIIPYNPGDSNSGFDLRKNFPLRIAVLFESIDHSLFDDNEALNFQNILGDLYLPISNPMTNAELGLIFRTDIISETLGSVDFYKFEIPEDLKKHRPFYNSRDFLTTKRRRPCLHDVGLLNNTWPLRFIIDDTKITLTGDNHVERAKIFIDKIPDGKSKKSYLKERIINLLSNMWGHIKERNVKELFSIYNFKDKLKRDDDHSFYFMEGLKIK